MHFPRLFLLCSVLVLAACTPPPPIADSQASLWQRFGQHRLDDLLLAWGAPGRETTLTTGARLVSYSRITVYDDASPYARTDACEVSYLAAPPGFIIDNIALRGDPYECAALAFSGPATVRHPYIAVPPPPGFYPDYYR